MNTGQGILLGFIQGLTEFLPISSSGHLVIVRSLLGTKQEEGLLFFDVALHLATLVALSWFLRNEIIAVFYNKEYILSLFVATITTVLVVMPIKKWVEAFFSSSIIVGAMLLVTGTLLFISRFYPKGEVKEVPSIGAAIILGIIQGIAVIPGISRSGSTITFGLITGLSREGSARFSFLMSIPIIIGAMIYEGKELFSHSNIAVDVKVLIPGMLVAAVVGYLAIMFLFRLIKAGYFSSFAYYCWLVGISAIVLGYLKN